MSIDQYIDKTQLTKDAEMYFGIKDISSSKLFYYSKMGLIEFIEKIGNPAGKGSISLYAKNTPGILYFINQLQGQGFQLIEIKEYLDLIKLNDITQIQNILEEDTGFNEEMPFLLGIDKKIKEYLIENVPINLFDYKKILTRLDYLERAVKLRAYAELDYKELTEIIVKNTKIIKKGSKFESIFNDILDNPGIEINLDIPEIKVIYKEPVSKTVIFKQNSIQVL